MSVIQYTVDLSDGEFSAQEDKDDETTLVAEERYVIGRVLIAQNTLKICVFIALK